MNTEKHGRSRSRDTEKAEAAEELATDEHGRSRSDWREKRKKHGC